MPGSQRHINQALCAISQTDFNFPSFLASLNRCEILFMILLILLLIFDLIEIGIIIQISITQ